MKTLLITVCFALGFSTLVSQAEEVAPGPPDALIHDLYKAEEGVFTPQVNKELSARFLTGALMELLLLDAKRAGEEQGAIGFDVLTYDQEERVFKKFATKSEIKDDTATVKASFENNGERIVITFQCRKEAGQWRVADVSYEDGTSLVKLLKDAAN